MCKTCGCDDDAKVTVTNLQTGNEETDGEDPHP